MATMTKAWSENGQVFTPSWLAARMASLVMHREGRLLEPSCGDGAFLPHVTGREVVAIEKDGAVAATGAQVMDFFDLPETEQFTTIIGNPPYVRYRDIATETKEKLSSGRLGQRANLYLWFIEKCVRHLAPGGELIFVIPFEMPRATAARELNAWMMEEGTFTHCFGIGDQAFPGASPPCLVFRYVRGDLSHRMADGTPVRCHRGQLDFSGDDGVPLGTLFDIRVGAVTGADPLYCQPDGDIELVSSETIRTGRTCRMLSPAQARERLLPFRHQLMGRGVRKFDESNWWEWGRDWHRSEAERIYVNAMTRSPAPFFTHPCRAYTGSIMALFPKAPMDIRKALTLLNQVGWKDRGFASSGRLVFTQRSLSDCLIPDSIAKEILHEADARPVPVDSGACRPRPKL